VSSILENNLTDCHPVGNLWELAVKLLNVDIRYQHLFFKLTTLSNFFYSTSCFQHDI